MQREQKVFEYIQQWMRSYCDKCGLKGFVVGVSGGIDSAVTATLAASTGLKTILITLPIRQNSNEVERAKKQIEALSSKYSNVVSLEVNLDTTFEALKSALPSNAQNHDLAMANSRARLRMTALYAVGQAEGCLIAGTGNKVEDFGIGFFTKYGDGGVDLSPIADLYKSEVYALGAICGVIPEILSAAPTDGLWEDSRNDEDQIGATYSELEWAMEFLKKDETVATSERQDEILAIFKKFNTANKHKMTAIPVCSIPSELKITTEKVDVRD